MSNLRNSDETIEYLTDDDYEVPDLTGDMVDDFEDFILYDLAVPVDLVSWLEARGIDTVRLERTIRNNR